MEHIEEERIVAHLDMDAFFASVEERDHPYLKGLPLVIGSDPLGGKGRGVVSTASYAARKYGIHSALPIQKAWKLSQEAKRAGKPECVFIVPTHHRYSKASKEVFALIAAHEPLLEQVSVDEGYVELSRWKTFAVAAEKMAHLRALIKDRLGLTITIGIAPNKLVAKLASEKAKPDGLLVVEPKDVDALLMSLPLRALPGIGAVSAARFARKGFSSVRDARALSWQELRALFGVHGFSVYERLRGIDERPVVCEHEAPKSIGKHHTFFEDVRHFKEVEPRLRKQVQSIMRSLKKEGFVSFRTVVLTVRFDDFTTTTRSLTLSAPRSDAGELELKAIKLALPFFEKRENPQQKKIRLIGLRVEKLL